MNIFRYIARHIPLIVILLVVIELVWTNTLVKSGRQVTETDFSITSIRQQNELLAQRVASASALTTIAAKAKEAGFVEPTRKQFVMMGAETLPVALIPARE